MDERSGNVPKFELNIIDKKMLRVILKKMKPARTHGTDWIDSFSLKVASPLLEDCLLNLVNLSIVESKFAENWMPQLIHPTHKKN